MLLKDIFQKDITRPINGVVKADQNDEHTVYQELDEYVVTKELDKHFRTFFDSYGKAANDIALMNNVGVWVSGFFGSGKSHFIKILSYLLANRIVQNDSNKEKSALEFFNKNRIKDAMLHADITKSVQQPTDVILFNIDSKATSKDGRNAIINVFMKVFNEYQGFSSDHPHIAYMERHLTDKGVYEHFQDKFEEINGSKWLDERDAYLFYQDATTEAIASALNLSIENANKWFEESEDAFKSQFSIENFCKWVKEYLDHIGKHHRIMFLVDEVGQFIGQDTQLMLTLQTITEELGTICSGRAWVVVTSQEDIESIIDTDLVGAKAHDFSKIQGRFKTRISLSSSNTDEVIQSRILSKTDESKQILLDIFEKQGDILKNQMSFNNSGKTLKNYVDAEKFANLYPFTPYQFDLVQKIFESIRKAGATGMHLSRGERSMLDAFQTAAVKNQDNEIGALVPVYDFYPTIESFIDTSVKLTIDKADEDPSLDKFDCDILKALFLIRYVDDIKGTLDNMTTLCIDQIDTDKINLRKKIEESFLRLEKQNLITRNGEVYQYLTKAEQDVTIAIEKMSISSAEENKLLSEIIFKDVLGDKNKYRYDSNNNDYLVARFLDGHLCDSASSPDLQFEVITELNDNYKSYSESHYLLNSYDNMGKVIVKLGSESSLYKELEIFIKTDKYIRKESDGLDSEHKKIIHEKQAEQRERKTRLSNSFRDLFITADFYAYNAILDIKTTNPQEAFKKSCGFLLSNSFNKLDYVKTPYKDVAREMNAILQVDDLAASNIDIETDSNSAAVKDIHEYIRIRSSQVGNIIVSDIMDKYSKRPFGWRDGEIVMFLSLLAVSNYITFHKTSSQLPVAHSDLFDYLNKSNKRREISVILRRQTESKTLDAARDIGQALFGQRGPGSEKELYGFLKTQFEVMKNNLQTYKDKSDMGHFPGKKEIGSSLKTINRILRDDDSFEFFNVMVEKKLECQDLKEDYFDLHDFYSSKLQIWNKLSSALNRFESSRIHLDSDNEASTALSHLTTIYNSPAPYGRLKDIEGYISKVEVLLNNILNSLIKAATEHVDGWIDRLKADIDNLKLKDNDSNKLLLPLQQLKSKISEQTTTANVITLQELAKQKFNEALEEAEEMAKPIITVTPISIKDDGGKPEYETEPVKIKKTVNAADIVTKSARKTYLENDDDVEKFVSRLKEELLKEINNDKRIRI